MKKKVDKRKKFKFGRWTKAGLIFGIISSIAILWVIQGERTLDAIPVFPLFFLNSIGLFLSSLFGLQESLWLTFFIFTPPFICGLIIDKIVKKNKNKNLPYGIILIYFLINAFFVFFINFLYDLY